MKHKDNMNLNRDSQLGSSDIANTSSTTEGETNTADTSTSSRPQHPALVVLNLEGVIVRTRINYERVRRRLRKLFSQNGVRLDSSMLHAITEGNVSRLGSLSSSYHDLYQGVLRVLEEEELEGAKSPMPLPGLEFLQQSDAAHFVLVSPHCKEATHRALESIGIKTSRFRHIACRDHHSRFSISESVIIDWANRYATPNSVIYMVVAQGYDFYLRRSIPGTEIEIVTVGIGDDREMTFHCPDYLLTDFGELAMVVDGSYRKGSLSVIARGANNADQEERWVSSAEDFIRRHFLAGEVLSVQGTLRDTMKHASMEYALLLPNRDEISIDQLVTFLPSLDLKHTVVGHYRPPQHLKWSRRIFHVGRRSWRRLMLSLGRIRLGYEGALVVPVKTLSAIPLDQMSKDDDVFSLQLLERLRRLGVTSRKVAMEPKPGKRTLWLKHIAKLPKRISEMVQVRKDTWGEEAP